MLDPLVGWGLVAIGAILFMAELLTPGQKYLMVPGTFFGTLGVIGLITNDQGFTFGPSQGLLIALALTLVAGVLTYYIYSRQENRRKARDPVSRSLIGKKGKVIKALTADGRTGRVLIGKTQWKALSDSDIKAGTYVEVVDMKGVALVVIEADREMTDDDEE